MSMIAAFVATAVPRMYVYVISLPKACASMVLHAGICTRAKAKGRTTRATAEHLTVHLQEGLPVGIAVLLRRISIEPMRFRQLVP